MRQSVPHAVRALPAGGNAACAAESRAMRPIASARLSLCRGLTLPVPPLQRWASPRSPRSGRPCPTSHLRRLPPGSRTSAGGSQARRPGQASSEEGRGPPRLPALLHRLWARSPGAPSSAHGLWTLGTLRFLFSTSPTSRQPREVGFPGATRKEVRRALQGQNTDRQEPGRDLRLSTTCNPPRLHALAGERPRSSSAPATAPALHLRINSRPAPAPRAMAVSVARMAARRGQVEEVPAGTREWTKPRILHSSVSRQHVHARFHRNTRSGSPSSGTGPARRRNRVGGHAHNVSCTAPGSVRRAHQPQLHLVHGRPDVLHVPRV